MVTFLFLAVIAVVAFFAFLKLVLLFGALSLHLKGRLDKAGMVIASAIGTEAILQLAMITVVVWFLLA